MENKDKQHTFSPKLIGAVAIIVFLGGSAVAWWANKSLKSPPQIENNPISTDPKPAIPDDPPLPLPKKNMDVYWLDDDLKLVATSVTISKANSEEESLKNIFAILLAGSPKGKNGTTIPQGTKLLKLSSEKNGIHLNLSQEFVSGGGSASMTGRLGQIIYTATTLNPNANVWIDVEGKPLEVLGGEGLLVEQPMSRKLFQEDFGF
jgi:spore germination protein GerM